MGKEIRCLWGQGYITDYIGTVKYRISPLSFYQVNPAQTEKLYGLAMEYAGLTGNETVWDLSTAASERFPVPQRRKPKKSTASKSSRRQSRMRRTMRKLTRSKTLNFFVGKSEEILPAYYEQYAKDHPGEHAHADVIVVDPPRKGCEENLLHTMASSRTASCMYPAIPQRWHEM